MPARSSVRGIRPDHKVVLIKIPRSAPEDVDAQALQEATSKWWIVADSRRDRGPASPDFAFAISKGRVVAVYRIGDWERAPSGRRWGFTGELSTELTTLYRGLDVTGYFPPGAANPLRYVHCDAPASSTKAMTAEVTARQRLELSEASAQLDREPLTHLMLGHRELFHSNLLAWFFRCLPEAADRVFGTYTAVASPPNRATRQVLREKHNLDLSFRWPDRRPLVIENKVFSLPDEKQLEGYASEATRRGESPAYCLLSLTDPSWTDNRRTLGGAEWRWIKYSELAGLIRDSLPHQDSSYEAETMRRYCHVVELLSDLVLGAEVNDLAETVSLPLDVRKALGDDRLALTLAKVRARFVAQRVTQALEAAGLVPTEVEANLTKAKPLNSWFCPIRGSPSARAGWQLQGDDFRLAVIVPTDLRGRSAPDRQKRYDFAQANKHLFDFGCVDDILGTKDSPVLPEPRPDGSASFNRFDPDFVYRYKRTPGITVADLLAAALAVARRLA